MARNISPAPGSEKPVQRGTLLIGGGGTSSATATIAAVNMAKSKLTLLGVRFNSAGAPRGVDIPSIKLTNSTTITAERASADGTSPSCYVEWELSEKY